MNELVNDIDVLENLVIAMNEGASDEKRIALWAVEKLISEKKDALWQFEKECDCYGCTTMRHKCVKETAYA